MMFGTMFAQDNFGTPGGLTDAASKGAALGLGVTIVAFVLLCIASAIFYFVFLRNPRSRGAGKSLMDEERELLGGATGQTKKRKKPKKGQP